MSEERVESGGESWSGEAVSPAHHDQLDLDDGVGPFGIGDRRQGRDGMFVVFLAVPDSPSEASRRDQKGSVSELVRWVSGEGLEEVLESPVWRSREIPKSGLFGDQVANDGVSWAVEKDVFSVFGDIGAVGAFFGVGSGKGALKEVPGDVLVSPIRCPPVLEAPDPGEGEVVGLFPLDLRRGSDHRLVVSQGREDLAGQRDEVGLVGSRGGVLSVEQEAFLGWDQFHHGGDGGEEVESLEVGKAIVVCLP